MNWSSETVQDKIVNFMDKVREYKLYVIIGAFFLLVTLIFLLPKSSILDEKYIELVGSDVITIYLGDYYEELGYKAYDEDNNIYTDAVIVESNLNTEVPGTYEITYKIDKTEVTRTIIVLEKPREYYKMILKHIGEDEILYLKIDSEYEEPGYQIIDNSGNDVTEIVDVNVINEVDTSLAGNYTVIYEFIDPNEEILTFKRDVIVIDNKLNLEYDNSKNTNGGVTIKIEAIDDYFDYILMPNGEEITEKNHTYFVNLNGEYKFTLYNKKGFNIEKTIDVNTIDKDVPTGSCKAYIKDGKTIVNVFANDNVGISKYEINGNNYAQNEITINTKLDIVNVKIFDTANNTSTVSCVPENKNITLIVDKNNYINDSVAIYVEVTDSDFDYLKLPNGNYIFNKIYSYKVTTNGTYTFYSYDKSGNLMSESITINNIDKELPNGTCQIKQDSTGIYIEVNATDNVGISKYEYNNKIYTTNEISLTAIPNSANISIYDKANNVKNITCTNTILPTIKKPTINNIYKDGVIINIEVTKGEADISGYYFSYNNVRPTKTTGGYVATSNTSLDVVRLPGTTYVWVEDKNGNISEPKTITLTNDALLITKGTKYKKLEGTKLSNYLINQGWSIEELNKLIARSSRAAGLYTKDAAATSSVALQTVLAQKYKIKLPYWWGGKSWSMGASSNWGMNKTTSSSTTTYYYYGLDCSGFTTWAYVNAGYKVKSNVYPKFWDYKSSTLSKENGEIGDFITSSGHVKLIIGKTDTAFITAEASGKSEGMIVRTHAYTNKSGYTIRKGERLMEKYDKIAETEYPSGF